MSCTTSLNLFANIASKELERVKQVPLSITKLVWCFPETKQSISKDLVMVNGGIQSNRPVHSAEPQQQSSTFPSTLPTS